jgi:hypothetical protein
MTDDKVIRAALAWWRGQRPMGWTEAEHLANPTVNTGHSDRSHQLAAAVGGYVKEKRLAKPVPDRGVRRKRNE